MSELNITYEIGDEVYFVLGGESDYGIVTALIIRGTNHIEYEVIWEDKSKGWHEDTELSKEKTFKL